MSASAGLVEIPASLHQTSGLAHNDRGSHLMPARQGIPMNRQAFLRFVQVCAMMIAATVVSAASAQPGMGLGLPGNGPDDTPDIAGEFAFVRVQYDSYYQGGFGFGPWSVDFRMPTAISCAEWLV